MKGLTITLWISFVFFLFARILFKYYVYAVPMFEVLLTPLLWLCIGTGAAAAVFIVLLVVKEFVKKKGD